MKYFLSLFFILCGIAFLPQTVRAAHMVVNGAPATVAQQQEFYVDVAVDSDNVALNGIAGTVSFSSDTLTFVRAETGTSLINYFIDSPMLVGNTIKFSGTIVGGFNGLIDPFNPEHKLPGQIVRLVFAGKAKGPATITTTNVMVTDNDGKGTLEKAIDGAMPVTVTDAIAPSHYNTPDTTPPEISASIVQDTNFYDGKYVLVFSTIDKESGIDRVQLQEGDGQWTTIQSPYLLHDQTRTSTLSLRAYDVAGNMTPITIAPIRTFSPTAIIAFLILLLLAIIMGYIIYEKIKYRKTRR